jgi:hypothetical protein
MKTSKHRILISMNLLTLVFAALLATLSMDSFAQSGSRNRLLQMIDEDRTTIDAIAGYDKNIQRDILQVAETPEILNKIEELQKRSQNQFRAIIVNYDQATQEAFYNLARYPNLITDLVQTGNPSRSEIDRIVSAYPEDIRETARKYGSRYFEVLRRIDILNNEIDREFTYALEPYSQETRESVNTLIGYPEIVAALVDDKPFTELLGEVYREYPGWVMSRLEQISGELAEQNREDLEAYKNQIIRDPEAYNELLDASERFSRERNEVRYLDSSEPIYDIRIIRSYPYWYGYPYWYTAPYWRPRPLYYHTGFYRNHFGNIVFVGLPSNFFLHWHTFYHPRWFPHLTYNYYHFYENHYMKRYRDRPHSFGHNGFYHSIESNVVNNPRVNNSRLEKIDHQRGNNIVRRPNTNESATTRRSNTGISRQNNSSYSRPGSGTGGSVNRRSYEGSRSGSQEGSYNRNGTIQRKGSTQSNGTIQRNSTIRRDANPATSAPRGTSTGRSQKRDSNSGGYNYSPRSNDSGTASPGGSRPASVTRRGSAGSTGTGAAIQQRSATPQVNTATPVPAAGTGRTVSGREATRTQKYSAPQQRGSGSAVTQPSTRSVQGETKATTPAPVSRKEVREKRSEERSKSTGSTTNEESTGRRR